LIDSSVNSLTTYQLLSLNSNTLKACMVQRFCDAVVWIAELVRVKKSWKLV